MLQTSIRIEESLYNKIVKLAKKDRRSINSEILYILQKYLQIQEMI